MTESDAEHMKDRSATSYDNDDKSTTGNIRTVQGTSENELTNQGGRGTGASEPEQGATAEEQQGNEEDLWPEEVIKTKPPGPGERISTLTTYELLSVEVSSYHHGLPRLDSWVIVENEFGKSVASAAGGFSDGKVEEQPEDDGSRGNQEDEDEDEEEECEGGREDWEDVEEENEMDDEADEQYRARKWWDFTY